MPSEPVSMAARSESRSPKRLSVTMTSNCFGQRVSCIAPASAYMWRELDVLVLGGVHLGDDLAPEHARFHHVGLFHRADPVRPAPRQIEGGARDAGDLAFGVALGVDADALVALGDDAARLAEVDAGGELAHDQDVEAGDHLALQRGEVGECVEALRRTQVGVEVHFLAQTQEPALRLHRESRGRRISGRRPRRAAPRRRPAPSPWSRRSAARRARRRRSRRPGLRRSRTDGRGGRTRR